MQTVATDNRLAKAWYIKYDCDAYALGPFRYDTFVTADRVSEDALASFCEHPAEIWPTGPTEETEEYEYQLAE